MITVTLTVRDSVTRHEITDETVIGRDPTCGVVVADPTVSRRHARLRPIPGGCLVEDLESKAGTFVNSRRVTRPLELLEGDVIRIGPGELSIAFTGTDEDESVTELVFEEDTSRPPTRRITIDAANFSVTRQYLTGLVQSVSDDEITTQFESLFALSTAVVRLVDRATLFREVARQLLGYFTEADRVVVLEEDEGEQKAKMVLYGPHARRSTSVRLSRAVLDRSIRKREAVLHETPTEPGGKLPPNTPRSVLCAPLWHGDRILGALYLDSRTVTFSEQSLRFLTAMAGIVASALQNVLLFEQVRDETAMRSQLARYFSKDLVERVLKGEIPYAREARLRRATILMVDLCGFTRMTTETEPARLIQSLNAYFAAMQRIIFKNRGTVERFGGDSILAYWGVIEPDKFAAWRACLAAIALQNEMPPLNRQLAKLDAPQLRIAVGLDTGEVIAGDVGSEERYEFTVLGDAANMARRHQEQASAGEIFVGPETVKAVGRSLLAHELEPRTVKGKSQPVRMASLYGVRNAAADGVQYDLAVDVVGVQDSLRTVGRATRLIFQKESEELWTARLTVVMEEVLDPGPIMVEVMIPGLAPDGSAAAYPFEGEVAGETELVEATTYWSGEAVAKLKEGPFEEEISCDDAGELLRALRVIS